MKKFLTALVASFLTLAAASFTLGEEGKSYEGVMSCEKCNLGTAEKCADALQVGDITYKLEDAEGKRKTEWHQCKGVVNAKVTGTAEERDGEQVIVVTAVEKEAADKEKKES